MMNGTLRATLADLAEHGPATRISRSSNNWRLGGFPRKAATMDALCKLGYAQRVGEDEKSLVILTPAGLEAAGGHP